MRFSILTVTFNAEKYFAETLQSVAEQRGVELEHLIWDGGSRDRTLEIARSFPHATLFEGRDSGIADAMNQIAKHATGDFLVHLHADDLFSGPSSLLMAQRVLLQHPHIEWLYGKAHLINEDGEHIGTTPYEPFSCKRLRKYNFITHPATVISRSLFEKVGGFQTHLRYCMDYDLWLRVSRFSSAFALSTPLACFRKHNASLSTKEPLNVTDEAYKVRNDYAASSYERLRSYWTWKKRRNKILRVE